MNRDAITLTRWAMRTSLNTWGISSATWVDHLPRMQQSIPAKNQPNRNIFVVAYQYRMMRDGKPSRPSLTRQAHATDHHRQTQADTHARAVSAITRDPTGVSGCAECGESLCLCTGQNQQCDQAAQRDVCPAPCSLRSARPTGLYRR